MRPHPAHAPPRLDVLTPAARIEAQAAYPTGIPKPGISALPLRINSSDLTSFNHRHLSARTMAPKRAVFSLNLDSQSEHYHQHVREQHPDGSDSVKVIETKGPTHDHTDLSYVSKPFERVVNRAVDQAVKDTGKKVHSVEGDIHYSSNTSSSDTRSSDTSGSNLNVKNKSTRRFLERRYDVSDL
jgi:hypothetical protein